MEIRLEGSILVDDTILKLVNLDSGKLFVFCDKEGNRTLDRKIYAKVSDGTHTRYRCVSSAYIDKASYGAKNALVRQCYLTAITENSLFVD